MKSLAVAVCLLGLAGFASAQAAVEGALTHALSGGATATAGKALGQIGNQLTGRLGQQTSNAVSPRVTNVRPSSQNLAKNPRPAAIVPAGANGGSLIASIEGGEATGAKTCESQNNKAPEKTADCKVKVANEADAHPSEITLPAPK